MVATTFLELEDQATGANSNTWGDVADANMAIIELAIARVISIATTGGTTVLTSSQNRYPIIRLTGTLASNATIQVRTAEKNWIFINATTGAFSITVKTLSGTGKTLPRGRAVKLYCDGTNVEHARERGIPSAQAGGTVDAITATFEPATVSAELQDGTLFLVEAAGANTLTNPTFAPDGLTARTITKNGGQALAAGDIRAAGHKLLLCYDETSTRYELLNPHIPAVAAASDSVAGVVELATNTEVLTGTDTARAVTPDGLAALWEQGTDIASASTISVGEGSYFTVTGTTTITDIDPATDKAGREFELRFAGVLTLTHNATTLILPGGANITTAAGDVARFRSEGGDNVRCVAYTRASGQALVSSSGGHTLLGTISTASGTNPTLTSLVLTDYLFLELWFEGVSPATGTPSIMLGNSTSDDVSISSIFANNTGIKSGVVRVQLSNGFAVSMLNEGGVAEEVLVVDTALSTASTVVSLALSGGQAFDAGSVRVYGVR